MFQCMFFLTVVYLCFVLFLKIHSMTTVPASKRLGGLAAHHKATVDVSAQLVYICNSK